MHSDMVRSAEECVVKLRGDLTVEHAHEMKSVFLEALQSNERVVVELEGITDVDLSFLQLLCSAHRTSMRLNKSLTLLSEQSDIFRQAVRDAGFSRILGCHEDPQKACLWIGGWES